MGETPQTDKTIPTDEQILELLQQRGSLTLCEMYQLLPGFDVGECALDGPLLELERRGRVYSRGLRRVGWGQGIVWHLATDETVTSKPKTGTNDE